MIKAVCISNRDEFRGIRWPEEFVALPNIGDKVRQIDGHKEGVIMSITHCLINSKLDNYNNLRKGYPYIEVYLEKKF